jgi:perosamine synthetase
MPNQTRESISRQPIAFSRPFFGEEEAEAAAATVRSGWVVGGPRLADFERRFADYCDAPHAVGVSSWTTGGFLVLHCLGIGPGDEVIVPSLTFIASVNVIVHVGATPVFADIDPATFNIDPDDVARKITSRTKAIMPVDQLGLPCDLDRIRSLADKHGLLLIQDAACSFASRTNGAPVGSKSPISIFSLHARKVITTGEGGMIVVFDDALAERLKRLRHQGMSLSDFARHGAPPTVFESYPEVGYNFRITDVQAAIGLAQLTRLPDMLARRKRAAQRYLDGLAELPMLRPVKVAPGVEPNWQSFQVFLNPNAGISRNELMDSLHIRGIATRRGVMASHLEEAMAQFRQSLPYTEAAAAQCLQLPMHAGLDDSEVDIVLSALRDCLPAAGPVQRRQGQ